MSPFLSLRNISKNFYGTTVLSDVSIDLMAGEVHSIVGENGAGKSTLVKVIAGAHKPSSGQLIINETKTEFMHPADAHRAGIYLVQQEPSLFSDLTIAENVFMGITPTKGVFKIVDRDRMRERTRGVLGELDLDLAPDLSAGTLSIGHQQMVEIAKALVRDVKLLILDEPTSTLSAHETKVLFNIVKKLQARGIGVLFISHRLEEVFELSDRITVLRDGKHIGTYDRVDLTERQLVKLMVGRDVVLEKRPPCGQTEGSPLFSVEAFSSFEVENISFDVYPGEVVGMAGLIGAGRTELAEAILGLRSHTSGQIRINGSPVLIHSIKEAIESGIAYIPEDRHKHGVALSMSILENVTTPWLRHLLKWRMVSENAQRQVAASSVQKFKIKSNGPYQLVRELSGGNQQKVVISKWLYERPKMIIFDEPTRGVDIGSKIEIHRVIDQLAKEGIGVIVISSDLPEILALSDRIIVMREGNLVKTLDGNVSESDVMEYATGFLN